MLGALSSDAHDARAAADDAHADAHADARADANADAHADAGAGATRSGDTAATTATVPQSESDSDSDSDSDYEYEPETDPEFTKGQCSVVRKEAPTENEAEAEAEGDDDEALLEYDGLPPSLKGQPPPPKVELLCSLVTQTAADERCVVFSQFIGAAAPLPPTLRLTLTRARGLTRRPRHLC